MIKISTGDHLGNHMLLVISCCTYVLQTTLEPGAAGAGSNFKSQSLIGNCGRWKGCPSHDYKSIGMGWERLKLVIADRKTVGSCEPMMFLHRYITLGCLLSTDTNTCCLLYVTILFNPFFKYQVHFRRAVRGGWRSIY